MAPIEHAIKKVKGAGASQAGTNDSEMTISLFEFHDLLHADKYSPCTDMENVERKLLHRKLMNRASAAISRERKRKYVQSLESKVVELENVVNELEVENAALKAESHLLSSLFEGKGIVLDDAMFDDTTFVEMYSPP
tara:strand:- start:2945 stop:3355 length:411 start_codon:yes stop_codon:yes gene_type:complete